MSYIICAMKNQLSAKEAADILGVSLATLYSYVSRGLLSSTKTTTSRSKIYDREEVKHLAARRSDAKHGGHRAISAIHWGVPLLETRISTIADGQLFYRGYELSELAQNASLETVACLLWDDQQEDYFAQSSLVPTRTQELKNFILQQTSTTLQAPLERAMVIAPALFYAIVQQNQQKQDELNQTLHPSTDLQIAPNLMRQLAAVLLDTEFSELPLHLQIAHAWQCDAIEADLIRASLVLLADHELNTSSFAVRCVASTGASLAAAIGAGLAALSGTKHGGGSQLAKQFLIQAQSSFKLEKFTRHHFAGLDPDLAGFGHVLYPHADPRAAYLLQRLNEIAVRDAQLQSLLDICAVASQQLGVAPNMDMMLAVMELHFAWPDSAGICLFAIARCAGWIAHAHEQKEQGEMIRPRARYVGKYRD